MKFDFSDCCLILGAACITVAMALTCPKAIPYFWGVALVALGLYRGL